MPLYLREEDVEVLLSPAEAVAAIEACVARLARRSIGIMARARFPIPDGTLNVMGAADEDLGFVGLKSYVAGPTGGSSVVVLYDIERYELVAVIEAAALGRLRTGAATAVAVRHLARPEATSLGVIGCGFQASAQIACVRATVPRINEVTAYCRSRVNLERFSADTEVQPAETAEEAAGRDVVITITNSSVPVIRGSWLLPGALVCAAGANRLGARELDDDVLRRAEVVYCDSRETAHAESSDLIEPIASGLLTWERVRELHEVVAEAPHTRLSSDAIVVFKSNGIAAWDVAIAAAVVERARSVGVGRHV
jgi:ornithine cyclodeaminase/alanine dehydrogenase-like protein (mu-crystallin family)